MLYVYAIGGAAGSGPVSVPDLAGFQDAPLRAVSAGPLQAVVSEYSGGPPSSTEDHLWTHERVVDRLMRDRTVLPMRFGTLLDGDDAVQAVLRDRAEQLLGGLRRVAGAIELGVRVAWPPPEADLVNPRTAASETAPSAAGQTTDGSSGDGSAYLMSMLDRNRRAHDLAERVDAPLRALARERRCRVLARPNLPLSASYLVERERAGDFQQRVAELTRELQDNDQAEIVCTGPWAPYGFASPKPQEEA